MIAPDTERERPERQRKPRRKPRTQKPQNEAVQAERRDAAPPRERVERPRAERPKRRQERERRPKPRTGSFEKRAAKTLVPITKAMEEGKEYMRTFGDLLQFHRKKQESNDERDGAPSNHRSSEAPAESGATVDETSAEAAPSPVINS
jgi:hypothetical protein